MNWTGIIQFAIVANLVGAAAVVILVLQGIFGWQII